MVLELAILRIVPGREAEFEQAFPAAQRVLGQAAGYLGHELRRGLEDPGSYALLVRWQTLEDHTVGFRQGPLFAAWRGVIGPFFAAPPEVQHYAAAGGQPG